MTSKEFEEILQKYLKGACTKEEKQWVEAWYHAMETEETENLDSQSQLMLKEKLWAKLDAQVHEPRKTKSIHKGFDYWKTGRVAAAIAMIVISAFLLLYEVPVTEKKSPVAEAPVTINKVTNTEKAPRKVVLSDGSFVFLQPESELRFPEIFDDNREVHLTGEAFFEVARDTTRPFLVYSNEIVTKVLGTSFSIKAYAEEDEIVVAVKSGKVSVFTQDDHEKPVKQIRQEVILTPNQQAVYDRKADRVVKKLTDKPQIIEQHPSLKMSYTNTPVVEIFEAIEKSYGVDIQFNREVLAGCTLTTDMAEEGLYERIAIICHALGAQYKVWETSIVIETQGGCY